MGFKRVTAIVNDDLLERVESRLRQMKVPGMTVSQVKGFGTHKNFYHSNWMDTCERLQVFLPESRVDEVVQAILETASTGREDDGIVIVSPVDKIYRIYDKTELNPNDM